MMAAAIIPLVFVFGLVVMFALGALPFTVFAGLLVASLLVGMAVAMSQMIDQMNTPRSMPK